MFSFERSVKLQCQVSIDSTRGFEIFSDLRIPAGPPAEVAKGRGGLGGGDEHNQVSVRLRVVACAFGGHQHSGRHSTCTLCLQQTNSQANVGFSRLRRPSASTAPVRSAVRKESQKKVCRVSSWSRASGMRSWGEVA